MKLEGSVQELELFFTKFHLAEEQKNKGKTSVARTTDVDNRVIGAINQLLRIEGKEQLS